MDLRDSREGVLLSQAPRMCWDPTYIVKVDPAKVPSGEMWTAREREKSKVTGRVSGLRNCEEGVYL